MSVHETSHAAGKSLPSHRHDLAYAALVLEGVYEEAGPEGVWRIETGDLVLHPPFHVHLNRFERGSARVLNVTLTHAQARALSADAYKVLQLSDPDRLARKMRRDAPMLLGEALEHASQRAQIAPRDWLDEMARALRETPRRRIGDLARAFGITPTHAARAFARRFGVTPAAFRAERRLRASLQALLQPGQSLADIATLCGFADQAHLTRALVQATGETPAQLRRSLVLG